MKAARDYLDFVDELMESARSADPGSDAERYDLAAAQVAATSALAAATLEATAAADQPAAAVCSHPSPVHGRTCTAPAGHDGPHAALETHGPVMW